VKRGGEEGRKREEEGGGCKEVGVGEGWVRWRRVGSKEGEVGRNLGRARENRSVV
jgi:hypothetical protein